MRMIECPHCRGEITAVALVCRFCGRDPQDAEGPGPPIASSAHGARKKRKGVEGLAAAPQARPALAPAVDLLGRQRTVVPPTSAAPQVSTAGAVGCLCIGLVILVAGVSLASRSCVGGASRPAATAPPTLAPLPSAYDVIRSRPGTFGQQEFFLEVLRSRWYKFAFEMGPDSDYSKHSVSELKLQRQIAYIRRRFTEYPQERRSLVNGAAFEENDNVLFQPPISHPNRWSKYRFEWDRVDLAARTVPYYTCEDVNSNHARTRESPCVRNQRLSPGVAHFSEDGQLFSLKRPDSEYAESFIRVSAIGP